MNIAEKKWKYYTPDFESEKLNYELIRFAPWSGHRNFAYDFTAWLEPKNIAELGSHYGCSAFAFTQAVKDMGFDTAMYFIDTWQGDDFTKKYDNDVFTVFSDTVKKYYAPLKINMLRMTFDEARDKFEDGSLELLHIDGSHHYEDVKHDFETWLPKVSKTGIIMLHDVSSDIVLGDVMGSYKYWQELKKKYKYTVDFDFSWGLGVIFLDKGVYDAFMSCGAELWRYQRINNSLDVEYKDVLRQNYFALKDRQLYIDDLIKQKEILNGHIEAYKKNEEAMLKNFEAEKVGIKADYEKSIKETVEAYEKNTENYAAAIKDYENRIEGYNEEIKKYIATVEGKDKYIDELLEKAAELEEAYSKTMRFKLENFRRKHKKQV